MTAPGGAAADLLYSVDEELLRESVRDVLYKQCEWRSVLERTESAQPVDGQLWKTLASVLGVCGLPVSESAGGAAASWRESAVVLEELGRAVAPVPYLGSAVMATVFADEVDAQKVLAALAAGETRAALVVSGDRPWFASGPGGVTIDGDTASGHVRTVVDAIGADRLLIPVGDQAYEIDAADPGVQITPAVSLDSTRPVADIAFDGALAVPIGRPGSAPGATEAAVLAATALLASEQVGIAEHCMTVAVDYLQVRRQFGRVLGSYQALKHRLADLWVQVNQARAAARYAADCLARGDADLDVAAAVAHSWCSEVAVRAAEDCLQLHGGIGFTWEQPVHLYLKRAKSSLLMFGSSDVHRAHLAELVDLPYPNLMNAKEQ
ncbi:acyl-CoA dehydrogenase family protein [Jongsikchunia kroppenstedtii]|uniref:acyl-CoA dehydrogenase family protein n=1 Tax=Jongsikchunia kroppenstedtii TaxID=1121721 RepID=UPI00036EEB26|nr:acyl-CoA dehydrogenase family protein [Jongsikchunia kroppenstedtii]